MEFYFGMAIGVVIGFLLLAIVVLLALRGDSDDSALSWRKEQRVCWNEQITLLRGNKVIFERIARALEAHNPKTEENEPCEDCRL